MKSSVCKTQYVQFTTCVRSYRSFLCIPQSIIHFAHKFERKRFVILLFFFDVFFETISIENSHSRILKSKHYMTTDSGCCDAICECAWYVTQTYGDSSRDKTYLLMFDARRRKIRKPKKCILCVCVCVCDVRNPTVTYSFSGCAFSSRIIITCGKFAKNENDQISKWAKPYPYQLIDVSKLVANIKNFVCGSVSRTHPTLMPEHNEYW